MKKVNAAIINSSIRGLVENIICYFIPYIYSPNNFIQNLIA